jgi:hypothetical protein
MSCLLSAPQTAARENEFHRAFAKDPTYVKPLAATSNRAIAPCNDSLRATVRHPLGEHRSLDHPLAHHSHILVLDDV